MGRQPCCDKVGLKRGPWTADEDHKLLAFILSNGIHCWRLVPKLAGLMRCGKSCRLRWTNYLRPDLKRGTLSEAEEDQIIELHSRLGNRWSKIASHFPGRTDNEIKNHWNTRIKKRMKLLGLDPVTHEPIAIDDDNVSQMGAKSDNGGGDGEEDGKRMEVAAKNGGEVVNNGGSSSDSCTTSLSRSNSVNPSCVGGQEVCLLDSFDSFASWDALYQLEDLMYFGV